MIVAILGAGSVGQVLAEQLDVLGHEVIIGVRSPEKVQSSAEFADWNQTHPLVTFTSLAEATDKCEIIINAISGKAVIEALSSIPTENLAAKVLIDLSNPLDFSNGFPPNLFVKDTDSLAEQIQRLLPETKVVKTLNTVNAHCMVPKGRPEIASFTVFLSGNDLAAKQIVREMLETFGHDDIIDLGDIKSARAVEMALPLWLQLSTTLGTFDLNLKVVR